MKNKITLGQVVRTLALLGMAIVFTILISIEVATRQSYSPTAKTLADTSQKLRDAGRTAQTAFPDIDGSLLKIEETIGTLQVLAFEPESGEDLDANDPSESLAARRDEIVELLQTLQTQLEASNKLNGTSRLALSQAITEIDALTQDSLELRAESKDSESAWWYAVKDMFIWLGPTSLIMIFVILALVWLLSDQQFRAWFSERWRKIDLNLFGMQVTLENLMDDKIQVESVYKRLMRRVTNQYKTALEQSDVQAGFDALMEDVKKAIGQKEQYGDEVGDIRPFPDTRHRYCLFVPSYIDGDIIQASEYGGNIDLGENNLGRRFSIRYGIVGMAYRLGKIKHNPKVEANPESLITEWGLTRFEANQQSSSDYDDTGMVTKASALIAIPIPNVSRPTETDPLGVIFIDIRNSEEYPQIAELKDDVFFERVSKMGAFMRLQKSLIGLRHRIDFSDKALDQAQGA